MVTCATVMKSLLLAAILVALTGHGSAVEKLSDCCTKVNKQEIPGTILSYMIQRKTGNCVNAIIFQTETGFYCSKHDEPWVKTKIFEFMKRLRASTTSFLKLITSTSTRPSTAPTSSATYTSSITTSITSPPPSSITSSLPSKAPPSSSSATSTSSMASVSSTLERIIGIRST